MRYVLLPLLAVSAVAQTPLISIYPPPGGGGGGSGTVTNIATGCGLAGGPITTTGTASRAETIRTVASTSDTILAADCGDAINYTAGVAVDVALPAAGGSFPSGWFVDIKAGAGTVTITSGSTINGAASLALTNQSARIISDGTNYVALLGGGSGGSSAFPVTTVTTQTVTTGATTISAGVGTVTNFVTVNTATTTIENAPSMTTAGVSNGQVQNVCNVTAAARSLVFQDASLLVGSAILTGSDNNVVEITAGQCAEFIFSTARSAWIYKGRNFFNQPGPPAGQAFALIQSDNSGNNAVWTYQLTLPATTAQAITSANDQILATRTQWNMDPDASYTLGGAVPVMADGNDGARRLLCNIDTTFAITIPDEANVANSNFRLGGANVSIGPRQCLSVMYSSPLASWIRTDVPGASSGGTAKFDKLWVPICQNTVGGAASSFAATNAPVTQCANDTGLPVVNVLAYATTNFDDSGTKSDFFQIVLPEFPAPVPALRARIGLSAGNSAVSQTFAPRIYTACYGNNQTTDPAFNPFQAFTPTTTSATPNQMTTHIVSSLDLTGCEAGEVLVIKMDRDTSDTSTEVMRRHLLRVFEP